jgi:hypothetical protein
MGSQLIETWASARSTQSTENEHTERLPKRKVSWRESVSANVITNSIRQDFQGIDGVEEKLRTRNVEWHKLPPRHRRVTLTQAGTIASTHLLSLDRSDQTTRVTATTLTSKLTKKRNPVNELSRSSSSKLSMRSGWRRSQRLRHRNLFSN